MPGRLCSWCGRKVVAQKIEVVVSCDHEARYWCCWVCVACQYALRDLLDDASSKRNGGTRQLGWWEDQMLYDLDGVRTVSVPIADIDQEPPAAG